MKIKFLYISQLTILQDGIILTDDSENNLKTQTTAAHDATAT
jgi:hypothetical protein